MNHDSTALVVGQFQGNESSRAGNRSDLGGLLTYIKADEVKFVGGLLLSTEAVERRKEVFSLFGAGDRILDDDLRVLYAEASSLLRSGKDSSFPSVADSLHKKQKRGGRAKPRIGVDLIRHDLDWTKEFITSGCDCFTIEELKAQAEDLLRRYDALSQSKSEDGFVGSVGDPDQDIPKFEGPPLPLTANLLSVPKLSLDLIPRRLRGWLSDIAERGCFPLEYPAAAALVVMASLIGRMLAIRPKRRDSWSVVPNLWGAIVGPPGVQKTPSVDEVLLPLKRLVANAMARHEEAVRRNLEDLAIIEAKAAAAKKHLADAAKKNRPDDVLRGLAAAAGATDTSPPPTLKRYLVNDATVEKLGELLRENPRGFLQFRDELSGWLRTMDKQGHESDRGFYLETWNGDGTYTFDRIGRGTVHIEALCLSVFGTIQPGPLARYLKAAAAGEDADGFIPRFQVLVYPDPPTTFQNVDRYPNSEAKNLAYEAFEWIDGLDPVSLGAETEDGRPIPFLRFSPEAQSLFDEWREDLENRLRSGVEGTLLTCHLSKYRSLMPSLSLLFHVLDRVGESHLGPVSLQAAKRAAAWCDFLEAHARRAYSAAVEGDVEVAARLGERIKQSLPNPFTPRQVAVKGWSGLDTVDDVRKALGILEDRNWGRLVVRPATSKGGRSGDGGRPSEEFWINPAVNGGAK